ncbi:MAG: GNAT family N-acetyltransferase [Ignavibacteriae bacterium]|nr:GNAT family N-acetyltransferase [Ignavibacteriota bacterium]
MIHCQREQAPSVDEVAEVFRASGIRRPVDNLERISMMIANANLIVTARNHIGKLVGIARALTDFSYCCYLSDLAVDKDYQRKGIGQQLINQVQKEIGEQSMLLLLAAPEAAEYYPHIGFEKSENAWIIKRVK